MSDMLVVQNKIIDRGRELIGTPFVDGGGGTVGYDCCTFIWHLFTQCGVIAPPLPKHRTRTDGMYISSWLDKHYEQTTYAEYKKCDIVVLTKYKVQHAGIMTGNRLVLHCHPRIGHVTEERQSTIWFDNCLFYRVLK